jgi:hypothetical protein
MGFRFRKTKKAGPFRLSLTKRGIGWSIGNKYIGYSHGASGRKSLRASIPGTGISYFANLGRKSHKNKRKSSDRIIKKRNTPTNAQNTPTLQEANPMPKRKGILAKIILGAVGLYFGSAAVIGLYQGITGAGAEPDTEIIMEAEPETSPTRTASGDFSAAEPDPPIELPTAQETETEPETEPETVPPETKEPETKAPETEPPQKTITITHKDSSLSPEMVEALEGVAAFWAPTGTKIHLNPFCRMFHGTVYAGTVEEANSVKFEGWCGVCSKHANENTKTNVNATPEVIADCYSYSDYINQIPAEAFD